MHFVDEVYDRGPVLAERRVPVLQGDTPATLAARVLKQVGLLVCCWRRLAAE